MSELSKKINCYQLCVCVDAMEKIYAAEGAAGLWRSTVPSAILAVNPAVQFMVYEALKRKLQQIFHSQVVAHYWLLYTIQHMHHMRALGL